MKRTRTARPALGADFYQKIFAAAYQGLITNLLLLVFALPVVIGFTVIQDPLASWPFLLVLGLSCGPGVAGAFGSFSRSRREDDVRPVRQFVTSLRATWWRALLVWAVASAAIVVVAVDALLAQGTSAGALLAPSLIIVGAVVVVLTITILVGIAEFPSARFRAVFSAAFLILIRQWYLGLISLAMLLCIAVAFLFQPVIGIFVTPSFLLFVVWANTRRAVQRLLDPDATETAVAGDLEAVER